VTGLNSHITVQIWAYNHNGHSRLSVPYGMVLQLQFFWQSNCKHNYDDCSIRVSWSATVIMYIEKLMIIISFTHKLVVAAAHWPGLCWQFQKEFPEPLETFLGTPCSTNINKVSLLPVSQMFMSSAWMLFICTFLCKAMWSTAHGYYSAGAGHSVALKQFSPSSCIQKLMRKETYLLTKAYVIQNIFIQL